MTTRKLLLGIIAAALLAAVSPAAKAVDHQVVTCEGQLVFGHGILTILPKGNGECDLSRLAYTDQTDDAQREYVFRKVTAVCGEPKKWATPHHCKVSGLAHQCPGSENATNGSWCIEFETIDTVTK